MIYGGVNLLSNKIVRYSLHFREGMCCRMLLLLFVLLLLSVKAQEVQDKNHDDDNNPQNDLKLLQPLSSSSTTMIRTLGPTVFPKPTDFVERQRNDKNIGNRTTVIPYLRPILGSHRADQDAVIAFAAEYPVKNHAVFLNTLLVESNFTGDVILIVSPLDVQDTAKMEFWKSLSRQHSLIIYAPTLECFNAEGESVPSAKGGIRTCWAHHLYGTSTAESLFDPRHRRTVANIRYELYWIATVQYHEFSWIMLVDFRDTYFQSNPFANLPRQSSSGSGSGLLYLFAENMQATRIGRSKQNRGWIQDAYGNQHVDELQDRPTICSGVSMGEQVALEAYLRAMVAEGDETGTSRMGSDQGFHNRLYYSGKLENCDKIGAIVVYEQGRGIVNNLGAMRTKELNEWGTGGTLKVERSSIDSRMTIHNWDGTPSPVVHQYDRHKKLSQYVVKAHGSDAAIQSAAVVKRDSREQ